MDINKIINCGNKMSRYRYMGSVLITADIDIDEILNEMSRSQKVDLYNTLKEDYGDDDVTNTFETNDERELFNICNKIYENRNSLTNEDKELLNALSKKGWYEKVK